MNSAQPSKSETPLTDAQPQWWFDDGEGRTTKVVTAAFSRKLERKLSWLLAELQDREDITNSGGPNEAMSILTAYGEFERTLK